MLIKFYFKVLRKSVVCMCVQFFMCVYNGYIWRRNQNWILDVQYNIVRGLVLHFQYLCRYSP